MLFYVWRSVFCGTQKEKFWRIVMLVPTFPHSDCLWSPKKDKTIMCFPSNSFVWGIDCTKIHFCFSQQQITANVFKMTWGGINNDRIFIFGWTILLMSKNVPLSTQWQHSFVFSYRVKYHKHIFSLCSLFLSLSCSEVCIWCGSLSLLQMEVVSTFKRSGSFQGAVRRRSSVLSQLHDVTNISTPTHVVLSTANASAAPGSEFPALPTCVRHNTHTHTHTHTHTCSKHSSSHRGTSVLYLKPSL